MLSKSGVSISISIGGRRRLLGDEQLGGIGGRLQRRVGRGVGCERPQAEARQGRLGAQLREQIGMGGADQPPRRAAGGHRRAERAADQRVEQRRLAGVVRPDDAGDQIGVAAGRARQQVALEQVERQRGGRDALAHRGQRVARAAQRRREIARSHRRHADTTDGHEETTDDDR